MQSRSGSKRCLDIETRKAVESATHVLIDPKQLISKAGKYPVISVGDFTSDVLEKLGAVPKLEIVDLKTKRSGSYPHREGAIIIENPQGCITDGLVNAIRDVLDAQGNGRIEVVGEEDLAVIPAVMYAKTGSIVAYGVPDRGMAYIRVNKEARIRVRSIYERMVTDGKD